MSANQVKWAFAAVLTATVIAGTVAKRVQAIGDSVLADMPDAPFEKASDRFPRIIPTREAPSRDNKVAFEAYLTERKAVWKYLKEEGAIRHAKPGEREAILAILDDKYAKGKSLALKALNADPKSVPALYALARARVEGDANLPDGLFLLRRARRQLEQLGRANPRDVDSLEWYLRVLECEHRVLVNLSRPKEALRAVDLLEKLYEPLPYMKVWSYFKLERLDDADAAIREEAKEGRFPLRASNDRLALEGLRHHRLGELEAGRAATTLAPDSAVIWSNRAEAEWACFQFDEAESAYRRSSEICDKDGEANFSGSPLTYLARLYVQEGRHADALEALRKARTQRARREPSTLQDDQADTDLTIALAMLALGRADDAERFARRAIETPDRLGHTSARRDEQTLSHAIVFWTVLTAERERMRERAAVRGGAAWPALRAIDAEIWTLKRLVARLARDSSRPSIFRPYIPGSTVVESWQLGSVLRMLPRGAALAMVAEARRAEDHKSASPYFDAIEAEGRLLNGEYDKALILARAAIEKLPRTSESLLRGRTAAVAGEAARRLGRHYDACRFWSQTLAECPAAPLFLGMAVPVRIENDGSAAAKAVADRLAASPRFRAESWGLPLSVTGSRVTLGRPDRSSLASVELGLGQNPKDDDYAKACDKFHERLVSPSILLTAVEVNALDGMPGSSPSKQADEAALAAIRPQSGTNDKRP